MKTWTEQSGKRDRSKTKVNIFKKLTYNNINSQKLDDSVQ
jgi:hypothetical protein